MARRGKGPGKKTQATKTLEASLEQRKLSLEFLKEEAALAKTVSESKQLQIDQAKELIKIQQISSKLDANFVAKQGESIAEQRQLIELRERELTALNATENVLGSIASKMGIATNASDDFLTSLVESDVTATSIRETLKNSITVMNKVGLAARVVSSAFMKIAEATVVVVGQIDSIRAGFTAATADISDARDMFVGLTFSNMDLAISFDQMSEAQLNLRENFAQFAFSSDEVRKSVTLQAAMLEKLGVDSNTTAKTFDILTMALGESATQAMATQRSLIGLAQALRVPPSVIMQEYTAAMSELARFGDRATEIFQGLSVVARETGTSVSDLTRIFGNQFNTFEGAVTIAGRLNQALRQDVFSGLELLNATDLERQQIVREGLALGGMQFEQLGVQGRLFVANALGISDMTVAARLLGETQQDLSREMGNTSFSAEEMERVTKAATASMDKLKFIFYSTAVAAEPLATALATIVQGLLNLIDAIPGGMASVMSVLGLAGGAAMIASAPALLSAAGIAGIASVILGGTIAGTAALGVGTTNVGDAVAPGGSMIVTPSGQRMKTSAADTVYASPGVGDFGRAMDGVKNEITKLARRPVSFEGARIQLEIPELGRVLDARIKDKVIGLV